MAQTCASNNVVVVILPTWSRTVLLPQSRIPFEVKNSPEVFFLPFSFSLRSFFLPTYTHAKRVFLTMRLLFVSNWLARYPYGMALSSSQMCEEIEFYTNRNIYFVSKITESSENRIHLVRLFDALQSVDRPPTHLAWSLYPTICT